MVPPCWWMSADQRSGVEPHRRVPVPRDHPLEAVAKAEDLLDAVGVRQLEDQPADDVVDPGAEPAAGHDARPAGVAGSKKNRSRGPASSNVGSAAKPAAPAASHPGGAIVEQDAIRLADVVHDPVSQPRDSAATGSDRGRAP